MKKFFILLLLFYFQLIAKDYNDKEVYMSFSMLNVTDKNYAYFSNNNRAYEFSLDIFFDVGHGIQLGGRIENLLKDEKNDNSLKYISLLSNIRYSYNLGSFDLFTSLSVGIKKVYFILIKNEFETYKFVLAPSIGSRYYLKYFYILTQIIYDFSYSSNMQFNQNNREINFGNLSLKGLKYNIGLGIRF